MNPLTNVKNINKLNEIELTKGTKKSWHDQYKDSAWIFIGGLAYGLTEGDVLAVFSQYGEIVNINLVRDKKTGKIKGYCFLCYENQKSTILAVDNLNGYKLLNRTIRVDHKDGYIPPKDNEHDDEITKQLKSEGCAPKPIKQETSTSHAASSSKKKKSKKEKKKHKKDRKREEDEALKTVKIKEEKHDPGYDKNEITKISKKQSSETKKRKTIRSESSSSETTSDDESFVNSKKRSNERNTKAGHIDDDVTEPRKNNADNVSGRKRNLRDSFSDSEEGYGKRKKIKSSHHRYKREKGSATDSDSSYDQPQPTEKLHKARASSSKSRLISKNTNSEALQQQYDSSSSEDIEQCDRSRITEKYDAPYKKHDRYDHDDNSSLRDKRSSDDRLHQENRRDRNDFDDRKNCDEKDDRRNYDDRRKFGDKTDRCYDDGNNTRKSYGDEMDRRKYKNTDRRNYNDDKTVRRNYDDDKTDRKSYDDKKDRRNYDDKQERRNYDDKRERRNYDDKPERRNYDDKTDRLSYDSKRRDRKISSEEKEKHSFSSRSRDNYRNDKYEHKKR